MATRIGTGHRAGHAGDRDGRGIFERYYAGEKVPCHVGCGGSAEVVRVATAADGAGELWVECRSCAQRVRYEVPPASVEERRAVERALDGGTDAVCPRHAWRTLLQRRGRQLVCPECGVRYRE